MQSKKLLIGLVSSLLLTIPARGTAQEHQHPAGDPEKLGQVRFETSCEAAVRPAFTRAVAMLHSFWYEKAAAEFTAVAQIDPNCAIAYWGLAMTYNHPLWEQPNAVSLKAGAAALSKAKELGGKSARERDYGAALEAFYNDFETTDHVTRTLAYEAAMQQLSQRYTDDREASAFYALALLGSATALPPDKTYARQKKAGAILAPVFAKQPEHPGLAHYIIHSCDFPPLAALAIDAARRYATIAPDSPHALHMPSHIFTRLGLWDESIASNKNSAASAHKYGVTGDELHALDYLMYAYLQQGQNRQARQLLDAVPRMEGAPPQYFAGLYATAAMPVRYALERHRWAEAASLKMPANFFPGGRYAWAEAMFLFASALGAARSGNASPARAADQPLAALRETLKQARENYWAEQVEIQRREVAAWATHLEGRTDEALALLRSAADREDLLGKHPVTPGAPLPARELLGDLLLDAKQPAQALAEYEAVLQAAPNRLNSLYGAARAAELAQNPERAKKYYSALLQLCDQADGERAELDLARQFLARK
ncbi:MAG: hypothetical protein ACRD35_08335 [Candidatus Acidiferrales bacterium]